MADKTDISGSRLTMPHTVTDSLSQTTIGNDLSGDYRTTTSDDKHQPRDRHELDGDPGL